MALRKAAVLMIKTRGDAWGLCWRRRVLRAGELPYVYEHSITSAAPRTGVERVAALRHHIAAHLEASPIARLLGTQPRAGFDVLDSGPAHSLMLAGRRRFSRCRLTFELTDAAEAATHLRARTCVVFPGARGQTYRALVIGTQAHTAATTYILRSVRRLSLAPA